MTTPEITNALTYLHRDMDSFTAENFDFDEYRTHVRTCLDAPESLCWTSMGADHLVDKANILEMINHAKVHIYIATYSSTCRYDSDIVKALKNAHERGVSIHVALCHRTGKELPQIWQDVKTVSTTFRTDLSGDKLDIDNEYLISDDTLRYEYEGEINENEVWDLSSFTTTHDENIDRFAYELFGTKPKALTQALDAFERKTTGFNTEDAFNYINRDFDNSDTPFDLKAYKKSLRTCFDAEKPQCWATSGENGLVDKLNILEMIERAEKRIYIVAKTDSKNIDSDTLIALEAAKERGVQVYVAVHKTTDNLPVLWQCMQNIAHMFATNIPTKNLNVQREHIIADHSHHFEILDRPDKNGERKWVGITQTQRGDFAPIINRFFYNLVTPQKVLSPNPDSVFSIVWNTQQNEQMQYGN